MSEERACVICLESDPPPIQSGCACRSDAGLAHVACRVRVAESTNDGVNIQWARCSTCKQSFTGPMLLGLSSAFSSSAPRSGYAEALEVEVHLANGDYQAAEKTARNLHDMLRRELGDEDEATLASASGVGVVIAKRGKHADAAQIQREVLDALKRAGIESETTITAMGGLANALSEQGSHGAARRLRNDAIAISGRILGAEHVTTLTLRRSCAWQLSLRGDHVDAVDETRKVLAVHKRVLGEEHPITLTTKSQLASCLFSYRRCGEATQLEREVLAVYQRADPTGTDATSCARRVDMMIDIASHHKSMRGGAEARADGGGGARARARARLRAEKRGAP